MKCNETKKLISDRDDIKIITYPHDLQDWSEEQIDQAKSHDVFDDLQRTAPIMWIDGEKIVGYLRIRKWLQDN
jgi:glutaredoxin